MLGLNDTRNIIHFKYIKVKGRHFEYLIQNVIWNHLLEVEMQDSHQQQTTLWLEAKLSREKIKNNTIWGIKSPFPATFNHDVLLDGKITVDKKRITQRNINKRQWTDEISVVSIFILQTKPHLTITHYTSMHIDFFVITTPTDVIRYRFPFGISNYHYGRWSTRWMSEKYHYRRSFFKMVWHEFRCSACKRTSDI